MVILNIFLTNQTFLYVIFLFQFVNFDTIDDNDDDEDVNVFTDETEKLVSILLLVLLDI